MKYITILTLLGLFVVSYTKAQSVIAPISYPTPTIKDTISFYAKDYGVSAKTMEKIIKNESSYNPKAIGDMNITCKKTGKPVRARGIAQITECSFPEVTDEQAFNPIFSIQFLAEKLSQGKCSLWTTCPLADSS